MKKMKKILTLLLTVCLLLPCFSTVSQAASGVIFFDDLSTTVGATFTIKGTVVTRNDIIGSATVQMTYDAEYLRFVSGDGVTKNSAGNLTYTGTGNGSKDRIEFAMTFQALKEGSTRMEQGTAAVTNKSGSTVSCDKGFSDIKIGAGDPSLIQPEQEETTNNTAKPESKGLVIGGVQHTPSSAFADSSVPTGFATAEVTYGGTAYTGIEHSMTGLQGLYLMNPSGKGDFYLYNPALDVFYPCEEIMISDEYSLIMLNETEDVTLGDEYVEANIAINGTEFPAWYNHEREGYFVVYAIGTATGEKTLYLYDSVEHTYQRMEMPAVEEEPVEVEEDLWTKITNFVTENLIWVMVGAACTLIVLVILLITLAVKLAHRNSELDDLYDEYQIDVEGVEPVVSNKQAEKKADDKADELELFEFEEEEYEEYEYEDDEYEEEEYEEEEYEEEYDVEEYDDLDDAEESVEVSGDDYFEEIDDLADLRRDISDSDLKPSKNYSEFYDDDDFEEESFEEESSLKQSVNTDTFKMDFIEFD